MIRWAKKAIKSSMFLFGIIVGKLIPVKIDARYIFFFPGYELGGAQKVHLDIVNLIRDKDPLVIFYSKSKDNFYLEQFKNNAQIIDLIDYPVYNILRFYYIGRLASSVNSLSEVFVFGVGSPIYYNIIEKLDSKKIKIIDLIHAYNAVSYFPAMLALKLNAHIVIDQKTYQDLGNLYKINGFEDKIGNIKLINNKVDIPEKFPSKNRQEKLRVLFVGRGTYEKRTHLIGQIAAKLVNGKIAKEIVFVGDVSGSIEESHKKYCRFVGEIADANILKNYYINSDVFILTSSREGFPLVLMEGMANGTVPIATAVGGIPFHIQNEHNGCLIDDLSNEAIITEGIACIGNLNNDRVLLEKLSLNCYNYAKENFSAEKFNNEYLKLFEANK